MSALAALAMLAAAWAGWEAAGLAVAALGFAPAPLLQQALLFALLLSLCEAVLARWAAPHPPER